MANLKKLNSDIRAAKAKKKTKKVVKQVAPAPVVDFGPLVKAIEKMQQPVVNIEQKDPVSWNVTVDLNRRGDMIGAKIEPIARK